MCLKCNQIWNKIKDLLNVRLHSEPIYNAKYIKIKVKTFNEMINTLFSGYEIPKEINHDLCIAAICIDSVLKANKKNYPQDYLEQCKNITKKRELASIIDDEVTLNSDYESDNDSLS